MDIIKVVSIGIIVGFTLVLSFIGWYWYKREREKNRKFNLD